MPRIIAEFVAGLEVALFAAFALAAWGVFPESSAVSGISYLPPSWMGVLAAITALACWWTSSRSVAALIALAYAVLVLPHADIAFRAPDEKSKPAGPRLSVIALNVQHYSFGIGSVARAIKQSRADVALISENLLDDAGREAAEHEFAPAAFRMGKSGETAIVSRYPIVEFHEVEFPAAQPSTLGRHTADRAGPEENRSFVHAVIDFAGTRVNVISVRLTAGRASKDDLISQFAWGLYLMKAQASEVTFLKDYLARLGGPYIFGGNLNAPPSSPIIRSLLQVAGDAYMAKHRFGRATFRVRVPLLRLDYILSSREMVPLESHRVEVEISDHFPVYAQFSLSKP